MRTVHENEIAGIRWIHVTGERRTVFRELGSHMSNEIRSVQAAMPETDGLRRWAETQDGQQRLEQLVSATSQHHVSELAELEALATGSGVSYQDLLLANLRGDIGVPDGTGCSDLAWRGTGAFIAHNEDGAPALRDHLTLVTLHIDGDAPVTAQWYPGFLPSNAFAANGHGLAWGINHIQVRKPAVAAGRHFVARALQQCTTIDAVVDYLRQTPSAGGFTYTIAEQATGRIVVVEAAGQQIDVHDVPPRSLAWHTNHLRRLPHEIDRDTCEADSTSPTRQLGSYDESTRRGATLQRITAPRHEPDLDWFVDHLTTKPESGGVLRTAAGDDPLMTLCTIAIDLANKQVAIKGNNRPRESIDFNDLTTDVPYYERDPSTRLVSPT